VAQAAERMKAMRERRRARGLRELRLIVPDARSKAVRRHVAKQVAGLNQSHESAALCPSDPLTWKVLEAYVKEWAEQAQADGISRAFWGA